MLASINAFHSALTVLGLVIYALGWGLNLFMLSLLTHAAFETLDAKHTARIYSAVGIVEMVGSLVGVPLLAETWAIGIRIGGIAFGLPFWLSAVMYMSVGIAVWKLRF
jgi:hypothetical protein